MDTEGIRQLKLRIYNATIDEFKDKGFKFTMDDIARRLSISKKTLYVAEKDKETLFYDTATYIYEQIKNAEQMIMDDDSLTTVEKIRAILVAMPDNYRELDWRQIYQLRSSYPRIYERVNTMMEQQWDNTIALLNQGMSEGVIRSFPVPVIKTMFEATLEKFMGSTVLIDEELTFDEALSCTLDIIMKGIEQ